jgi:hypothetical protein
MGGRGNGTLPTLAAINLGQALRVAGREGRRGRQAAGNLNQAKGGWNRGRWWGVKEWVGPPLGPARPDFPAQPGRLGIRVAKRASEEAAPPPSSLLSGQAFVSVPEHRTPLFSIPPTSHPIRSNPITPHPIRSHHKLPHHTTPHHAATTTTISEPASAYVVHMCMY